MASPSKLQYPSTKELAERVEALEKRIDQIEADAQRDIDELLRRDAWIQLCLTALLSLCRWAYAWCKQQGSTERQANFMKLGTALKEAIEQIEPEF